MRPAHGLEQRADHRVEKGARTEVTGRGPSNLRQVLRISWLAPEGPPVEVRVGMPVIAAAGLGLGAVWIGVYPYPSKIKPLAEVLGIPENVIPLSMVLVGHPAEKKEPRTQYDEHKLYWQSYEPRKRRSKIKNAKKLP